MALQINQVFNGILTALGIRMEATTTGGVTSYTPRHVIEVDGIAVGSAGGEVALPVQVNNAVTNGDGTITTSGTSQALFGGTVPTNGWKVNNPHPTEDLWINDAGAASSPNTCIRIFANGGQYATEPGEKPAAALSIYGASAGHVFIARRW